MSTYHREKPEYIDTAIRSIWVEQTRKPDQIVLVEDGPLTPELDQVISKWQDEIGKAFTLVKLNVNQGLALALNKGLEHCQGDIVVRMDTDDIAFPERIKEEVEFLEQHKDIDVVGSWVSEFVDRRDNVVSIRKTPETSTQIYQYGKYRNPMNHPSVVFRKDTIMKNGGFRHLYLFEDYYLWVILLKKGIKFHNIQKSLLWFRTSEDLYARRGGIKYALSEIKLLVCFYRMDYISFFTFANNCIMRLTARILPNKMRGFLYKNFLRGKANNE